MIIYDGGNINLHFYLFLTSESQIVFLVALNSNLYLANGDRLASHRCIEETCSHQHQHQHHHQHHHHHHKYSIYVKRISPGNLKTVFYVQFVLKSCFFWEHLLVGVQLQSTLGYFLGEKAASCVFFFCAKDLERDKVDIYEI